MPIYEYRCHRCGDFDQMQKITDNPLKKCPTCKGKVTKLISNPAFHLKGGGWYITDYARKGGEAKPAEGGASESKAADSSGSGSTSESETKTEKKAEKTEKKDKKSDKKATSASAAA